MKNFVPTGASLFTGRVFEGPELSLLRHHAVETFWPFCWRTYETLARRPIDIKPAGGHCFGPTLKCHNCGLHWEDHNRES